ncbi:MAG TPA: DsbC family protein [Aquabacterium sp.]|uniref:DsbC family protein n=1 Tax=Aquabacterium sp. TaxID=1872578 RepID=UPI002E2F4019|nr:DsbC family protein [Aquabacterium sp.]HEX5356785.1 DsbC family protein [Aquabacterium sp.]
MISKFRALAVASLFLTMGIAAHAQSGELPAAQLAVIKAKLAQRVPELPPVESARSTPVAGLIEVKVGNQIIYTDANGEYVIEGQLLETRTQRNLTEERMDEINKVDFANLPFKDAIVWKNGNGKRRLVIFADPNCGYCKHLERDLQQVKDVTVYTFMIPILGDDSRVKVDNIWCVKDRTLAWRDWMLNGSAPAKAFGMCASPAQRNLALSQKLRVNGTPAMFFEDGSRLASAASAAVVEQRLSKASAKVGG